LSGHQQKPVMEYARAEPTVATPSEDLVVEGGKPLAVP
jgi:hypothetical protein